jgi:predicted amino acid racemase
VRRPSPRIEIDLAKIEDNARLLVTRLAPRGIEVTGVTKAVLGHPAVAAAMLAGGVARLGDSRLENLARLCEAGLQAPTMLIRSPTPEEADRAVAVASISLVSEAGVVVALAAAAARAKVVHDVIAMVELGDLREGVLAADLLPLARIAADQPGVRLVGLGANLACRHGVDPGSPQMNELADLGRMIRTELDLALPLISGGNSANLTWALGDRSDPPTSGITDLRIGEAILLGTDPVRGVPIDGLHTDAFTLVSSVIESLEKPSMPWGERGFDSFGGVSRVTDRGRIVQTIVSLGRQDVELEGLTPPPGIAVLGASSDHLVLETPVRLVPGTELRFRLGYGGLLRAMTSPFVAVQLGPAG